MRIITDVEVEMAKICAIYKIEKGLKKFNNQKRGNFGCMQGDKNV